MRLTPRRQPFRRCLLGLLCAALVLTSTPTVAQLPSLGDAGEIALSTERELGDRIMREVYRDADYLDDPVLTEYVRNLWQPLRHSAKLRGELTAEMQERFAWQVLIVRERTVNAFALPGGYMGVHLGLIMLVNTRDELASVLAHELTHITQRHISRGFNQQAKTTPLMIAALILAALAASKNPKVTEAVLATSQAATIQSQLNFSRDMEREADRIGFSLMEPSGYQPQAFVSMFELMQRATRLNDNGNYPYLRSHPLTSERIADMQLRLGSGTGQLADTPSPSGPQARAALPAGAQPMGELPAVLVQGQTRPDVLQRLMGARARIFADSNPDAWRRAISDLERLRPSPTMAEAARQAGALYGAVLAAIRLRDYARAEPWLKQLQLQTQDDAEARQAVRWLQAEWAIAAQRPLDALAVVKSSSPERVDKLLATQAALQLLRQRNARAPRLVMDARIDALSTDQPWLDAEQHLTLWVQSNPSDAPAWEALAALAKERGMPLRGLRAEAEAQVALLNLGAALDRLRAAQELARRQGGAQSASEHIDLSIIDSRTREVARQLRELQVEQSRLR